MLGRGGWEQACQGEGLETGSCLLLWGQAGAGAGAGALRSWSMFGLAQEVGPDVLGKGTPGHQCSTNMHAPSPPPVPRGPPCYLVGGPPSQGSVAVGEQEGLCPLSAANEDGPHGLGKQTQPSGTFMGWVFGAWQWGSSAGM